MLKVKLHETSFQAYYATKIRLNFLFFYGMLLGLGIDLVNVATTTLFFLNWQQESKGTK